MPTPTHYLRLEGVNQAHSVFDTRDLSTMRGGSLLLLEAVTEAKHVLGARCQRSLIEGASIGLFEIATDQPQQAVSDVRARLSAGAFQHVTFVVDVLPVSEPFRGNLESLMAANRWRQAQASSLAVPPVSSHKLPKSPACILDGLSTAQPDNDHKVINGQAGLSTMARREHGRNRKQNFYQKLTGLTGLPEFANEFKDIATDTAQCEGKLAIFYADGNKFSSIQSAHCKSADQQLAWDLAIRAKRKNFLTSFLRDEALQRPEWKNKDVLRFETLLWGGDELMFVMPAALGWRFNRLFFEHFGGWKLDAFQGQPLTQTAALVFFQHHAPIDRLKRLAKDQMSECAKGKSRERDQLLCVVLESFDHLGSDYEAAMKERYGAVMKTEQAIEQVILHGAEKLSLTEQMSTIADALERLKAPGSEFARSQLRSLVTQRIRPDENHPVSATLADAKRDFFFRAKEHALQALEDLEACFPSDDARWVQLEELWDYALP